MDKPQKFTMHFETTTVDHLGLHLYGTLPPVISELVSNAFDAESKKVEITLPEGPITEKSEVVIRDYGHGLTAWEVQNEFLPIGRCRRGDNGSVVMSKNQLVRVTGRKGLGKLSAFGVAEEMDVRFIHKKNATCLRINYPRLKSWPDVHGNSDYEPEIIASRSGRTSEPDGAEIRLRHFHRTRAISIDEVRKGLARRLTFIGSTFKVVINGGGIKPGDRVRKSDCETGFCWDVADVKAVGGLPSKQPVSGWVGFIEASSQANRGIDIFANNKAVELGSYFNLASTHAQFARAHLVGEIHANFLDEGEDNISTARTSVVWESENGSELEAWGQQLLRWAFGQWVEKRREKKEQSIFVHGGFEDWLGTRLPTEQKVARRMVSELIKDDAIDEESAAPLLEVVKSSVEAVAFQELVNTIEEKGANSATLLKLFKEWRVIEAREHLRRADGRLEALSKLRHFMNKGALEVQEMQPLLEQHPWLLNPKWSEVDGQNTYTAQLRKNCIDPKEPVEDRRMDILGISYGGACFVVEIKRPEVARTRHNLRQIEDYVTWARTHIMGTGPHAPKYVYGLLVVGHRTSNAELGHLETRLAGDDIRVETFQDLYESAKEYYGIVEERLRQIAPEYTSATRKKKKAGALKPKKKVGKK